MGGLVFVTVAVSLLLIILAFAAAALVAAAFVALSSLPRRGVAALARWEHGSASHGAHRR